jgi:hypothetical protein
MKLVMHVSWTTLREQIFAKLRRPYRSEANMNEVGHEITDVLPKRPVLPLSKRYRRQRESTRWAPTILTSCAPSERAGPTPARL